MSKEEYSILDGRYSVEVGARGGVSVYSNVAHGKKLKVYGKHSDNYRYINMTRFKGGDTNSYSLVDVLAYCVDGGDLVPLCEGELQEMIRGVKAPVILEDVVSIEALKEDRDTYGNVVYVEELEHYTRRYQRINQNTYSNGFLKFSYKTSTYCLETKTTTAGRSNTFIDKSRIIINDVNKMTDEERQEIKALL